MMQDDSARLFAGRLTMPEILNTACHDMRAALAVTVGSANELASPAHGELSEMQQKLVQMIRRGNDRINRLATNLMHLAELLDGSFELRASRCDLRDVVRQTVDELQKREGQRVSCELLLDETPLLVDIDVERTRQALGNCVSLAFATARKSVRVAARRQAARALFTVEDDGPVRRMKSAMPENRRVSSSELVTAVAQELLRIQQLTLVVEDAASGSGTHVGVSFPLS